MKFIVSDDVFAKLETVCFGVVVARGVNNRKPDEKISSFLAENVRLVEERFAGKNVRETDSIAPYREAFVKLGMNPNKFLSSIEAMVSRVVKQKRLTTINPAVDLANAISLKYLVPLGAHDLGWVEGDMEVRFSTGGELFRPFGSDEWEVLEQGELVYAAGGKVKTRRWIWRQSEDGKITGESRDIFFPIDGFMGRNDRQVIHARDELALWLAKVFGCEVKTGFIDRNKQEMEL